MKRAMLALAVLVLAGPAAAVVQNGSSPSNTVGEGRLGITSAEPAARTTQSFGGEGGPQYDLTFRVTNTTPEMAGDKAVNVSRGEQSVVLTGRMQVPTPCHELSTSVEQTGELVVTVNATPSGGPCVQQIATKHYRLAVNGSQPFRLEVRHATTGLEVRTVETTAYRPGDRGGGILAWLGRLLAGLF
ncbi:MAG: hypothetical protein SVU88_04960 [Candidatus Nanohaloarchaea archaeon]|nr:hypothetical protein [Candidatus Nanohaloarchaea archaeon]